MNEFQEAALAHMVTMLGIGELVAVSVVAVGFVVVLTCGVVLVRAVRS